MASGRRPILVVDDEDELRAVFREFLESRGHEVLEAVNGLEALWAVKRRRPGLVLLDLAMPRLGGVDTIKHIQKFDASIRVIVVTSHLTEETAARLAALGVKALLKSEFNLTRLEELVSPTADQHGDAP